MRGPSGPTRRVLIAGAGLAGAWLLLTRLVAVRPVALDFEPLADPSGFRRLAGGPGSGGSSVPGPLAGLDAAPPPPVNAMPPGRLCEALFGVAPPGAVPVAYFYDYACPYCLAFSRRLAALAGEERAGLHLTWHEWPLLGARSQTAARAAAAAGLQGAYRAFHEALMGSAILPTEAYLRDLASRSGIDPDRLLADMDGAGVARRLALSASLAARFGFIGTPGLVIGRTAVDGAIGERALDALLARERADGPVPGCPAPPAA